MIKIFLGLSFVVLITLVITNSILLKNFKSKILWIILSCALPVVSFGIYYRYQGQKILEETRKLAELRLVIFQFYMIFLCIVLVFILQLVKLIHLLSLRKKKQT